MQCIVVTPERTVRDEPADFVAVTLFDGELGIAQGHTPLLGRLGFGEMRITRNQHTDHYYVEGGFVEVLDDVVTVLTGRAISAEKIDEQIAEEQLHSALAKEAHSPEMMAVRQRAIDQSRAQILVAKRAK
jgi:F-type H+-transporting ATPase subunit epsilon